MRFISFLPRLAWGVLAVAAIYLLFLFVEWNPLYGSPLALGLAAAAFVGAFSSSISVIRDARRGDLSAAASGISIQVVHLAGMLLSIVLYLLSSPLLSGRQPG